MTTLGAQGKCLGTVRKKDISRRCVPTRCETGPSRCRWKHRGPKLAKTLQREVVRPIGELESEVKTEIPLKKERPTNGLAGLVRNWRVTRVGFRDRTSGA